jgi:hypothetical protein
MATHEHAEHSSRQTAPKRGWSTSGKITANPVQIAIPAPPATWPPVAPPAGSNQVALQAEFAEVDAYSVMFATNNAVGNGVQTRALHVITVEGSSITRVQDVDAGAGITIVGGTINSIAYDVSPDFAEIGTITYDVYIQCSRGTRGSFNNPPRLTSLNPANGIPIYTIPAAGSLAIADISTPAAIVLAGLGGIPTGPSGQLAGAICVNVALYGAGNNDVPYGSVQVQMVNNANVIMAYEPRDFQWAPVAPGTQYIQISNKNAGFAVVATITYGVDG